MIIQFPTRILSLDLGVVNSAYALLDNNFTIKSWTKVDFQMPKPYSPASCFENVGAVLSCLHAIKFVTLQWNTGTIVLTLNYVSTFRERDLTIRDQLE